MTAENAAPPHILVFDSGLGGLTVLREIERVRPDARLTYLADDAVFPYGALKQDALIARVMEVMRRSIPELAPDLVVIACNTASTLVLPPLRAAFPIPFVGTVPAVKTGAERSRSKRFSVLATPGTVERDYTHALIAEHAADCAVTLVGCRRLAGFAEDYLRHGTLDEAAIMAEIAPAFVEEDGQRTDAIVLACTHYPLLLGLIENSGPWPVTWIDPAPAIARRVGHLLGPVPVNAQRGSLAARCTSPREREAELVIRRFFQSARSAQCRGLPGI